MVHSALHHHRSAFTPLTLSLNMTEQLQRLRYDSRIRERSEARSRANGHGADVFDALKHANMIIFEGPVRGCAQDSTIITLTQQVMLSSIIDKTLPS